MFFQGNQMDILGIDIGTVSIKYLRWKGKKGKGIAVSKGIYQYKGDVEDLSFILSQIKEKEGTSLEVVIGIVSQEILKKSLTMPILPKEEVREALNWSVSKVISTPLEDMNYEYVMLGEVEERGIKKEEALFMGVQKSYVLEILSIFEKTGFDRIRFFTDSGFIYAPVVDSDENSSCAVIDIGGRQTGISIIQKRKLRSIRELMTASESFSDAIMSGFNFSYKEAETYKIENGFNDISFSVLSVPLNRLAGEIQRTFNVYNQRYPEQPIKKIYVTGKGSQIPNLLVRLKDIFNEDIEPLDTVPGIETEFLPSYILCTNRDSCVNLLPPEIKTREKDIILKRWSRIATVGIMAVLFFFSMIIMQKLNTVNTNLNSEKNIYARKTEEKKIFSNISSTLNYSELAAAVKKAELKDITFILLMKYLSSGLPDHVHLRNVVFEAEKGLSFSNRTPEKKNRTDKIKTTDVATSRTTAAQQSTQKNITLDKDKPFSGQDYFVSIKGYIYGEEDVLEPALLDLAIKLNKTGFLRNVEILNREVEGSKDKGVRKIMHFELIARCPRYEV